MSYPHDSLSTILAQGVTQSGMILPCFISSNLSEYVQAPSLSFSPRIRALQAFGAFLIIVCRQLSSRIIRRSKFVLPTASYRTEASHVLGVAFTLTVFSPNCTVGLVIFQTMTSQRTFGAHEGFVEKTLTKVGPRDALFVLVA